jgi:hypothetical protein
MTAQAIPTDTTSPYWSQTTVLDGVPYILTFRYNAREAVYYLTISASDGVTIYEQFKIVANYPLLQAFGNNPPGELVCLSSNTDDSPPALGEMGEQARCTLVYLPEADVFNGTHGSFDDTRFAGFLV